MDIRRTFSQQIFSIYELVSIKRNEIKIWLNLKMIRIFASQ